MEMQTSSALTLYLDAIASLDLGYEQGLVKGAILCFRNGASQLTSPASQKSKDLNKVPLLLHDLG